MVVGRMNSSPSEIVGNSSGVPPPCQTPRLTYSANSRKLLLQLFRSLWVWAMPMIGRARSWSSRPMLLAKARRTKPYMSGSWNQASERRPVEGGTWVTRRYFYREPASWVAEEAPIPGDADRHCAGGVMGTCAADRDSGALQARRLSSARLNQ